MHINTKWFVCKKKFRSASAGILFTKESQNEIKNWICSSIKHNEIRNQIHNSSLNTNDVGFEMYYMTKKKEYLNDYQNLENVG